MSEFVKLIWALITTLATGLLTFWLQSTWKKKESLELELQKIRVELKSIVEALNSEAEEKRAKLEAENEKLNLRLLRLRGIISNKNSMIGTLRTPRILDLMQGRMSQETDYLEQEKKVAILEEEVKRGKAHEEILITTIAAQSEEIKRLKETMARNQDNIVAKVKDRISQMRHEIQKQENLLASSEAQWIMQERGLIAKLKEVLPQTHVGSLYEDSKSSILKPPIPDEPSGPEIKSMREDLGSHEMRFYRRIKSQIGHVKIYDKRKNALVKEFSLPYFGESAIKEVAVKQARALVKTDEDELRHFK